MEQNQRLEQEIKEMNDQFTLRQNERLAQQSKVSTDMAAMA